MRLRPVGECCRSAVLVLAVALAGCSRPQSTVVVGPKGAEPDIRIGLGIGQPEVVIGGGAALVGQGTDSVARFEVARGSAITVASTAGRLRLRGGDWSPAWGESITFAAAEPDGFIRVGGRDFRGEITVFAGRNGLTVINRVALESYLAGVVSAEMGRRDSTEHQAVFAQAVISRTYALQNRGRWNAIGFDFYATVVDQVYGGVQAETPLAWRAVNATAGQVVTYNGATIDAFFFSTCGGKTARGTEVFASADRPYLVSIEDTDAGGAAYCRISPRYDWRVEWSGESLRDILREGMPTALGPALSPRAVIHSVRIADRFPSGRVSRLVLSIDGREFVGTGPAVRQVLRPARGELLRSSMFTLSETTVQGRLLRLVAVGHGAGHGVGMCQWGAVGRARAGQTYAEILAAYFPHTDLERLY